jgi:hypothetical protein
LYLTAASHISSRAFPSTILSATPTLVASDDTEPVLLPGVDAFNHARAQPVSWFVKTTAKDKGLRHATISLVLHAPTPAQGEIFNNYGPKPNSEFILGYGFSIPRNPDDTIILKIGGGIGIRLPQSWQIGRKGRGLENLWSELLSIVSSGEQTTVEHRLDAADMLGEMTHTLIEKLPKHSHPQEGVREDVYKMWNDYIEGKSNVLHCFPQLI